MRFRRPFVRTLLATSFLPYALTGCYSFAPTAVAASPKQPLVRAHLSDPARQRLWAVVPSYRRYLDGRMVRVAGDTLLMEVTIQGSEGAGAMQQQIQLARDEVLSLESRELSRTKTYAVAAVFTLGALALLAHMLTGKAGGGTYPPVDGGPTESILQGFGTVHP